MNKENEIKLEEIFECFKEIKISSWIKELFYLTTLNAPSNKEMVEGLTEFSKSQRGIIFMTALWGSLIQLTDALEAIGGEEFLEQKEELDTWIASLSKDSMN